LVVQKVWKRGEEENIRSEEAHKRTQGGQRDTKEGKKTKKACGWPRGIEEEKKKGGGEGDRFPRGETSNYERVGQDRL